MALVLHQAGWEWGVKLFLLTASGLSLPVLFDQGKPRKGIK
jgi:hypothetical protein